MNALEIIGLIASASIAGVAIGWALASTTRPPKNGVVQRKHRIIKWEDKP
jgi:hypothetical protein